MLFLFHETMGVAMLPTDSVLQLVRLAAEERRRAEQHFRATIAAARASGLPLTPIAEAGRLSVARIHAILEEEKAQTYASAPSTSSPVAADDVLVVAAGSAYDEYLNYHAYICQEGRSFRDVQRIGFYRLGKIEPHFPTIRAAQDHVEFSSENAERLRSSLSPVDRELADLITTLVSHHRRDDWDTYQVFLLTPPADPQTLTLPQPIMHDTRGRGSAWTFGHRYISEGSLLRTPRNTDEL
jgi:hypothetical protein